MGWGLGIDRAPTKECGVISDEDKLIGRAKEKYEGMWEKGVDYELGDLWVENNRIEYSRKGNKKMNGSLLVGLGGGLSSVVSAEVVVVD